MDALRLKQIRLCEQLQLLELLESPDTGDWEQFKLRVPFGKPTAVSEARILDLVAHCLARDGKPIATALDRRIPLTFVLATSGPPTHSDRVHAARFFSLAATAEESDDIVRFILAHSSSFTAVLDELCLSVIDEIARSLDGYQPRELAEEFHNLGNDMLARLYEMEPISDALAFYRDKLDRLRNLLVSFHGEKEDDGRFLLFSRISFIIHLISGSRFLNEAADERRHKFRRILDRVQAFIVGSLAFILVRNRFLPENVVMVPHQWADEFVSPVQCLGTLRLSDSPTTAARRTMAAVDIPYLNWQVDATPSVHAGIKVLLHLEAVSPTFVLEHESEKRILGRSTGSCMGCVTWIQAYNTVYRTRWLISPAYENPRTSQGTNWALPGIQEVDNWVITSIEERVWQMLTERYGNDPSHEMYLETW